MSGASGYVWRMDAIRPLAEVEAAIAQAEATRGTLEAHLEELYEARKALVCGWVPGTVLERAGRHWAVQEVRQHRGRVTLLLRGVRRRKGLWVVTPTMYPRVPEHELHRYVAVGRAVE